MTNTNQKRKAIFPQLLHIIPLGFIIVIKPFPHKGKWKERRRQLGVAVSARPPRHQCGEVDHLVPSRFAMHCRLNQIEKLVIRLARSISLVSLNILVQNIIFN
ncbi:BnaA09g04030D [Brassica napus]|uniref:BnaA09g04030D protein n=1 Tax=Brassica napus TaxID=3708 RepID=A0A078FZJ0_BRANA|nr:BnaA09g04030D [Brassica napus]